MHSSIIMVLVELLNSMLYDEPNIDMYINGHSGTGMLVCIRKAPSPRHCPHPIYLSTLPSNATDPQGRHCIPDKLALQLLACQVCNVKLYNDVSVKQAWLQ